jgi:hypothetical protein
MCDTHKQMSIILFSIGTKLIKLQVVNLYLNLTVKLLRKHSTNAKQNNK